MLTTVSEFGADVCRGWMSVFGCSSGVVLLLPLAVLWWQSHPHSRRGALALSLIPATLLVYLGYMHSIGYGWTGALHQQLSADHGHHGVDCLTG